MYFNKRLITLGGISPQNLPLNCVHSYNLETQMWSKLPLMKFARVGMCVVNVDGIIYVIGGYISGSATNTAEKLVLPAILFFLQCLANFNFYIKYVLR